MAAFGIPFLCALALASAETRDMPDVNQVMSRATETAHDFVTQARMMQQRVDQKQALTRKKLTAQKDAYEAQLAAQEDENRAVVAANMKIRAAVKTLQDLNAGLRNDSAKLEESNTMMREGITALQAKIATAEHFLVDSLRDSDDTDAQVLKVLDAPKPKPTLNHFLKVARSADDELFAAPVALLELSGSVKQALRESAAASAAAPEEILNQLENGLRSLEEAEREGETQLKAHFLAAYEVGDKRHSELLEQQRSLNETRATEETLNQSLHLAKRHLIENRAELKRRIHGLEVFAQSTDETVKDVLNKAATMIKAPSLAAGAARTDSTSS